MKDFDKLFENYLRNELKENEGLTPDELEDMIPELYERWATTPNPETDGLSPEEFFARVDDPEKLVGMFVESNEGDSNPCSLLCDRITEVKGCDVYLGKLVDKSVDPKTAIAALNLICESGAEMPTDKMVDIMLDESADEGLREACADELKEEAGKVAEKLYAALPSASLADKEIIADVLVEGEKDERTYELLRELFATSDNLPFVAGLIGKYGDERAAEYLYPALDDCNYMEYIEIRNAIEQMGGVVDDTVRDFSDDEFYKAIKNLK